MGLALVVMIMLMCFLDGWVKYYDVECLQYAAVVVIAESERNEW